MKAVTTISEPDGLAKSSRNIYFSNKERNVALCLSKSIKVGKRTIQKGMYANDIISEMCKVIEKKPLAKIDYMQIASLSDMQPVEKINTDVLVAIAVYIGSTRLTDNFIYRI